MAVLTATSRTFYSLFGGAEIDKEITTIDECGHGRREGIAISCSEIFEQPQAIINTIGGRIDLRRVLWNFRDQSEE